MTPEWEDAVRRGSLDGKTALDFAVGLGHAEMIALLAGDRRG